MFVNISAPRLIGQVRLSVFVESGCVFKALFVEIEDGTLLRQVKMERVPGNGKILVAHSKETAEGQHRVSDAACTGVEDLVFDFAQVFVLRIDDLATDDRLVRGRDFGISCCSYFSHFLFLPDLSLRCL